MFDGKFRGQRVINLGGKKSVTERNQLLADTRKQREARSVERTRIKNAIKIQAYVRGVWHRYRLEDILRREYDKRMKDIENLRLLFKSSNSSFSIPIDVVIALIRSYIFLSASSSDFDRLSGMKHILSDSCTNSHKSYNYLSLAISQSVNENKSWQYQAILLCEAVAWRCYSNISLSLNDVNNMKSIFQSLICAEENPFSFPVTTLELLRFKGLRQGCARILTKSSISLLLRLVVSRNLNDTTVNECFIDVLFSVIKFALFESVNVEVHGIGCHPNALQVKQALHIANFSCA